MIDSFRFIILFLNNNFILGQHSIKKVRCLYLQTYNVQKNNEKSTCKTPYFAVKLKASQITRSAAPQCGSVLRERRTPVRQLLLILFTTTSDDYLPHASLTPYITPPLS
jgi:hypothetical protein